MGAIRSARLITALAVGHAAEVSFAENAITHAQLRLKTYTFDTQTLSVLPPAQAAALVPAGSILQLVYSDTGSDVTAGWQS